MAKTSPFTADFIDRFYNEVSRYHRSRRKFRRRHEINMEALRGLPRAEYYRLHHTIRAMTRHYLL